MMRKAVSLILSLIFIVGIFVVPASAAKVKDREEVIAVESAEALEGLDRDVPVVTVPGFGEALYKGLETETEEDDSPIFFIDGSALMPALKKHLTGILKGFFKRDYDLVDEHLGPLLLELFSDVAANPDGTVKEGTGNRRKSEIEIPEEYSYEHDFFFRFDWRKDMHTLAGELNDYIAAVKEATGSEKVALVAFSQGNCIVSTYLYEYYYTETDAGKRDGIDAVVFMCSAMNGVGSCEDPYSGNIKLDSLSLLRFLKVSLENAGPAKALYYIAEILYSIGVLDSVVDVANEYVETRIADAVDPYLLETFGGIPGFYAMMSPERYREAEEFLFATEELQEKYKGMLEKNRYYHDEVQVNIPDMIDTLIADGKNVGIIAEYGYPVAPVTSDNDRMTDFSICTSAESCGAVCSAPDGTLGEDYKQAKECECGKNHVSSDLQIDASTCLYPDITWFGKYLKHDQSNRFWGELVDLIIFSDEQIDVWTYSDYPQFMESYEDSYLIPLTEDGTEIVPFEDTLIFGKKRAKEN